MNAIGVFWARPSGAALIQDGKITAAVSEERFSRKKNDSTFPINSLNYCIEVAGGPTFIDCVGVTEFYPFYTPHLYDSSNWDVATQVREQHEFWYPKLYQDADIDDALVFEDLWNTTQYPLEYWSTYSFDKRKTFAKDSSSIVAEFTGINPDKVIRVDHHESHALYGYYASQPSSQEACLVLTVDGSGDDGNNATVYVAENSNLTRIYETDICVLGRIYSYVTLLLGMKRLEHEYKVMGLAPYAGRDQVKEAYKVFSDILDLDGFEFRWNNKPKDSYFYFKQKLEGHRFDAIAGGMQLWVEETLVQWVRNLIDHTSIDNIVISGGVSMNCKAMGVIGAMPEVRRLRVGGSSADDSHPVGTAIGAVRRFEERNRLDRAPLIFDSMYLGPHAESTSEEVLESAAADPTLDVVLHPTDVLVAELLAAGKVLGRCVGRMEFGQRALGNRSIIADPSNVEIVTKINSMIKQRDFWMPFAPVVLDTYAERYLVNTAKAHSPHMTIAFQTTAEGWECMKAACHPADRTARAQILVREDNPELYALILEFEQLTGRGALLNTSLNFHGHPLVNTAKQAFEVLLGSGLDGLLLSGGLILKTAESSD